MKELRTTAQQAVEASRCEAHIASRGETHAPTPGFPLPDRYHASRLPGGSKTFHDTYDPVGNRPETVTKRRTPGGGVGR